MKNKKKILMLFSRPPFPLIGGDKIRMYQNARILSKKYEIDILYIEDMGENKIIKEELMKFSNSVYSFKFNKAAFYFNTIWGFIFNNKPLQVNYYYFKKIQDWIDNNIYNYDAVFCSSIRTSEYVYNKKIYKIIDYIDAISMNYDKAYEKSDFGVWKFLYKIDKERLKIYERNMLSCFNLKLIISDVDRKFITGKKNIKNFNILLNSVRIDDEKINDKEDDYILFVGKMNYEPNVNAVKYFSSEIFPSIQQLFPSLQFYIAGANPEDSVKKLERRNNKIIVTGYVENLNELIIKSKLVVAPMISGAGIQNKILQAMALKKCVVTTPIGAEGLNTSFEEMIISGSSEIMIQNLIELLVNAEKRSNIGLQGFRYVKDNFSETAVQKKLLSFINI